MSIYLKNSESGEIWLRKPDDTIFSAASALSSIFKKYEYSNNDFYLELASNQIKKFDIIYDVIYLETASGYSFDKFEIDENENFLPSNLNNNFQSISSNLSHNFWFDDYSNKIFSFYGGLSSVVGNENTFHYVISVFDSTRNIYTKKLDFAFKIEGDVIQIVEPMVVSYNSTTSTFNSSSIFRTSNNQINLISINIIKNKSLEIDTIKIVNPFATITNTTALFNNIFKLSSEDFYIIFTESLENIAIDF